MNRMINRSQLFYICIILKLFLITTVSCFKRSDVYIAGFFPYGEGVENSATGRGVMPSVKLALDHVNEHQTILRNYRLHMWWNDTECNAAVGVKSFFDMMHSGPHKLMLFGATCTHVTDPIAKASKHWHLTQLSYADTHPMFTKDAFPNFFRVVPSENAFNGPRLALLKEFNWTRVGTIYQNEPRYSLPHNGMVADLDSMELEVVETQSFVNDVSESLKKLREKDVRIILGNFNEYWARKVFCEAYRLDMYGRSFQWLIMGTYSVDWWNTTIDTDCTVEELTTAMEATIMTDLLPLSTTGDITISGITADEYLAEYDSRRGAEYSRFHGYTYDGIWAAALAIQYVSQRKEQFLTQFEYRVKDWENIFLEALKNTSFEGVTGPVRFYNNERKANILIKQFQNGQEEKIGEYNSVYGRLDLTLGKSVKWVGRSPPKDRTLIHIEHGQINITIYVVSASCSVVGIIIALIFLAFNIKYRNQRYIKMSSPHLNNLIIVGCMLTYLSIIFLGLDTTLSSIAAFPYICTARVWLLMAGFSLAFGAMFSKTWRVHSIFTDLKLNKKVIKDYQLFMVVGILLAIDIIIITTWQIADPFYRATKRMEPKHHENMEDILVIPENEYCQSEHITIFVGIIYAYKGLLLIFGAFLAWETRHVSIPALNDSKHIGFSVYNVFITCLAGAAISLVLADRKDLVFVLLSFFIIFCTTATLCLVFVPKLVELKRNPQGAVDKRIRATLRPMSKNRRDSSVCELEQRLKDVKTTNCRFRKALMEKEAELQALIRKLGPEARKWLEGGCTGVGSGITNTYENDPLLNDMSRLSAPSVRRDMPSATEVTELTSVDSVTSTHAEMDTTNSVTSSTAAIQAKNKFQTVTQMQENLTNVIPQQQQISQPQHLQITNPTPTVQQIIKSDENVLHHRNVEKRNSVSAQTDPPPQIPNAITKKIDCNIIGKSDEIVIRERRQSSTEHRESKRRVQENGSQTSTTPQSKHNTVHRNSTTNLQNSSNIDINNICPHTKNNNNNNTTNINNNNHNINNNNNNNNKVTTADGRKMSVHAMSSGKGNFVVSQSDLWDTHTLSHAKQHSRQSPRNHPNPQQRCEHSHIIPYDTNTTSPIQRSVSEKNRGKHRHKPQKGTVCQSETDSEREQREPPTPPPSSTTQARAKLAKSIQQHAHHHSSPNVAPDKRKLRTKTESSMYNACSESELVGDTAILPIFRKLLTEKQQPRQKGRTVVGQSCPNISIKCDIVEYL